MGLDWMGVWCGRGHVDEILLLQRWALSCGCCSSSEGLVGVMEWDGMGWDRSLVREGTIGILLLSQLALSCGCCSSESLVDVEGWDGMGWVVVVAQRVWLTWWDGMGWGGILGKEEIIEVLLL